MTLLHKLALLMAAVAIGLSVTGVVVAMVLKRLRRCGATTTTWISTNTNQPQPGDLMARAIGSWSTINSRPPPDSRSWFTHKSCRTPTRSRS